MSSPCFSGCQQLPEELKNKNNMGIIGYNMRTTQVDILTSDY